MTRDGLWKAISRKGCKIGGTLVLITNRKSYMSFRLVSKVFEDVIRRKKFTFVISSPDEFLVSEANK